MYLHVGQDFVLNDREIIGVFDLDTATDAGQKAKSPMNSCAKRRSRARWWM